MYEPFLWEPFKKRMRRTGMVRFVYQPFLVIQEFFFKVGAVFQYISLFPLVAAGQEIAVIHIPEGREPFKNMRVLFHSATLNSRFVSDAVPQPERRIRRRVFSALERARLQAPLSLPPVLEGDPQVPNC